MIVELVFGFAAMLVLTLVFSHGCCMRSWFFMKWLMYLLSLKYRIHQRRAKGCHCCRKYTSIREFDQNSPFSECKSRIHHLDKLEPAQRISQPSEAMDDVHFCMTNFSGDWITVGLQRSKGANILLNIGLNEHGLFQHPKHPQSSVWSDKDGFQAGDLKIELLEPRRRWRIAYNGWLRKGIVNPVVDDIVLDESCGEFVHVKFYFIWEASTDPFDKDIDVDALARTHAYGVNNISRVLASLNDECLFVILEWWDMNVPLSCPNGNDGLAVASSRTDQYGEMHGHVWIDGEKLHVRMRGAKLRQYVPDPRSLGFAQTEREAQLHSVIHYITLETGVAITVGLIEDGLSGSDACLVYGYVMMPIGGWTTVSDASLCMADLNPEAVPMEYSFNFTAGNKTYTVHVICNTSVTVNSERDMTCSRPIIVNVNQWKGTGILQVRKSTPEAPLKPNAEKSSNTPRFSIDTRISSSTPSQKSILEFKDLSCQNAELVGGKGSSLAQLTKAGDMVLVPPGFCITVSAYQRHLTANDELGHAITRLIECPADRLKELCDSVVGTSRTTPISAELREEILKSVVSVFGVDWEATRRLAVRSSAVGEDGSDLSCAGQMDTYLGVKGQGQLLEAITKCWSSQYSYQAVQYRRQHGQCTRTNMCVVVQEMVPSDLSGVMFTCDPISGNPGRVTINASYGLGEAVVSGVSEPDTIILDRTPANDVSIQSRLIGTKQITMHMTDDGGMASEEREKGGDGSCCISDQMALKLARIGIQVGHHFYSVALFTQLERYYGDARDVEWAIHDDVIYILQARPITSFDTFSDEECMEEFDLPLASERCWLTTGNIGEMSPGAMTPLSLSVFLPTVEFLLVANGPRGLYQVCDNHVLGTTRYGAEMTVVGQLVPEISDQEVLEYTGVSPWWRRLSNICVLLKARRAANARTKFWEKLLETYHIFADTARELYSRIDERLPDYIEAWLDTNTCTSKSGMASNALVGVISGSKNEWKPEHFSDVAMILEKCDDVYSADVPSALRELSVAIRQSGHADTFISMDDQEAVSWLALPSSGEVHELYTRFLSRHGHRCVREAEFRETSWRSEPTKIIPSLKLMLKTAGVSVKERSRRTLDDIIAKLKSPLNFKQRQILRRLIPWATKAVGEREWGKSITINMVDRFKQAYRRLGQLMAQEGYIPDADLLYFFTHHEIGLVLGQRPPGLITKAIKRRRLLPRMAEYSFPLLSHGHPRPNPKFTDFPTDGSVCLTGTPVSHGVVRGVARIVKSLPEASAIQEGDILLVPHTDVGWTPYFPLISGLVTEIGSILSHGAVVAREYGLPCIVNCKGATDAFRSGDQVLLDASQGLLTRITE